VPLRIRCEGRCSAQSMAPGTPRPAGRVVESQESVENMRRSVYPTPAWLGVGATPLMYGIVDSLRGSRAEATRPSLSRMEIIELQAGQAYEPTTTGRTPGGSPPVQESRSKDLALRVCRGCRRAFGVFLRGVGLGERLRLVLENVPPHEGT